MASFAAEEQQLTEQEKERYDRQIRVWGAEAQSRIQSSKVLICGLRGLAVEVRDSVFAILKWSPYQTTQ